jgi:hypothetical protein
MPRRQEPYYSGPGNNYVFKNTQRKLKQLRKLPIFNRNTGGALINERKRTLKNYKKVVSSPAYNYPTDNRRVLSLSQKSFTDQTKNLLGSQYFINQFRGTNQDNYNLQRSRKNYYVNREVLSQQARMVRDKEESAKLAPLQQFFQNSPARRILNNVKEENESF